jgi:hypothetical protein
MRRLSLVLGLGWLALLPASARAQYADPPNPFPADQRPESEAPPPEAGSTVRASVGPALRVSDDAVDGGLAVALDIGARAAGGRVSGAWVRAGSDRGLSQYTLELWIDFGTGRLLHPVLGAGAGLARLDRTDENGVVSTASLGVGVLRGTLEYVLPVPDADARAGIDLIGSVAAIRGSESPRTDGWLLALARVGVGF